MEPQYIQVGVIAARTPDGAFLPELPIYREAPPGFDSADAAGVRNLGKLFAQRMKEYIDKTKPVGSGAEGSGRS